MKTLLQKASEVKVNVRANRPITQEHIDLAIAWATGQVTFTQASQVLTGKSEGVNTYIPLARALKEAIATGQIKVVKK